MTRPWSLRRRLAGVVALALVASFGGFSLLLHETFERALRRQLDARLTDDARAVADLFEEREGRWDLEPGDDHDARFAGVWYEVRTDRGEVLARFPDHGDEQRLAAPADAPLPRWSLVRLPDGATGRMFEEAATARSEEGFVPSGRKLLVRVARHTREVETTLATFRLLLFGAGLAASALAALVALLATQRGLRVIDALSARIGQIDAQRLGERIPEDALPHELLPPVRKLNELLGRLGESFERERRFNADVSHELRTPLAGLLAILELAASRERTASEYREAIGRATEVAREQRRLVEGLLMLARAEVGGQQTEQASVPLHELCDVAFAAVADQAASRRLRFENRIPPEASVTSDPALMRVIASNLLSNAAAYTEEGGWIAVDSEPAKGLLLAVSDSGPPLPPGSEERIFERFVRLDAARSGESHHGIGLSLVRALCTALGLTATVEQGAKGSVAFCIRGAPRR